MSDSERRLRSGSRRSSPRTVASARHIAPTSAAALPSWATCRKSIASSSTRTTSTTGPKTGCASPRCSRCRSRITGARSYRRAPPNASPNRLVWSQSRCSRAVLGACSASPERASLGSDTREGPARADDREASTADRNSSVPRGRELYRPSLLEQVNCGPRWRKSEMNADGTAWDDSKPGHIVTRLGQQHVDACRPPAVASICEPLRSPPRPRSMRAVEGCRSFCPLWAAALSLRSASLRSARR